MRNQNMGYDLISMSMWICSGTSSTTQKLWSTRAVAGAVQRFCPFPTRSLVVSVSRRSHRLTTCRTPSRTKKFSATLLSVPKLPNESAFQHTCFLLFLNSWFKRGVKRRAGWRLLVTYYYCPKAVIVRRYTTLGSFCGELYFHLASSEWNSFACNV